MIKRLSRGPVGQMDKNATLGRGFTLIELLVVLAIVVIIAALVSPSYAEYLQRERHSRVVNLLSSFYKLARSEATKREQGLRIVWQDNKAQLEDSDSNVLRIIDLSDTGIDVSGLTQLRISATGSVLPVTSITIIDPKGHANPKWICVLASGQLYVSTYVCTV